MIAKKIIYILVAFSLISLIAFGCKSDREAELEDKIIELEEQLSEEDASETEKSEEEKMDEEAEDEETTVDITEEEAADEEDEDTSEDEGVTPTINLTIYQDATYSAADDVCYYRIEAQVTGSPNPSVSWSKDDSSGAFGNKKAQVNLSRGETYILTATASNSSGSATDSITLNWECDGEEVAEEDREEETEGAVMAIRIYDCEPEKNLSGYIEKKSTVLTRTVWAGDNASNRELKGYLSFDISRFVANGERVGDARLKLNNITHAVDPTFAENLIIKVYRYGNELTMEDWEIGGENLASVSTSGLTDIVITGNNLIDNVQKVIDSYGDYFQIKIGLSSPTDNDNVADFFNIDLNNSILELVPEY